MKALVASRRRSLFELAKFGTVGVINTGVDVAVFFLLTSIGVPYIGAQVASYPCGAGNSYVLNKVWTFRKGGRSYGEMFRFIVVNLASLGMSVAALRLLHANAGLGLAVAKGGATGSAFVTNFLGNKLWVFR